MYFKSLILILTTTVVLVSSGKGRCPTNDDTFKPNWYSLKGDWYEYASYGDGITRLCYKCIKYSISKKEESVSIKRDYTLKLLDIEGSSQYTVEPVSKSNFILEGEGWTSNLSTWMLLQSKEFLILWSCKEYFFGTFHIESSWILTAIPTESLSSEYEEALKKVLQIQNMNLSWYGPVQQNSCPYPLKRL